MTKFYYVYTLYSKKDHNLYVGYSTDLKKRYIDHQKGKVISTKHRRPLELIHYEGFVNMKDAKSREKYLKSGFGKTNLKASLKNIIQLLGNN
jgi:putative endonuclease